LTVLTPHAIMLTKLIALLQKVVASFDPRRGGEEAMETTKAREIYESILQTLLAQKRELEGTGNTGEHEAEAIDEIVVSLKALELQDSPVGR